MGPLAPTLVAREHFEQCSSACVLCVAELAWARGGTAAGAQALAGAGALAVIAALAAASWLLRRFAGESQLQSGVLARQQSFKRTGGPDQPILFSEFMTGWLELTWPKVAEAASKTMEAKLESALEEALRSFPSLRKDVSFSVKFGARAPQIPDVFSYKKQSTVDEGISICGHMRWAADLQIELQVGPAKFGIDEVQLEGVGCIVAKPLLPRDPVLGGMQIFFCDPPSIKLSYTGLGSWARVHPAMDEAVRRALSSIMVLPQRMNLRFANTKIIDYPEFRNPPPIGAVRVHLIAASNIVAAHAYSELRGRLGITGASGASSALDWMFSTVASSSYCVVRIGAVEWRTRSVPLGCNPRWGTTKDRGDFLVHHERQVLGLDIFDNRVGLNNLVGSVRHITLYDLLCKQRDENPLRLDVTSFGITRFLSTSQPHETSVSVQLEYFDFSHLDADEVRGDPQGPHLLTVKLYHVAGLPRDSAKGLRLRVRVGDQERLSKRSHSIHPKDHFGFGVRQSKVMHKLHLAGTPIESLAAAYGLDVDVVREVIAVESRDDKHPGRFGWDEAMYVLVSDPCSTSILVEMQAPAISVHEQFQQERWLPLELCCGALAQVVQEGLRSRAPPGPGGGLQCRVRGDSLLGCQASVGVSLRLTAAQPLAADEAVDSFDLGRSGGEATWRGYTSRLRAAPHAES